MGFTVNGCQIQAVATVAKAVDHPGCLFVSYAKDVDTPAPTTTEHGQREVRDA